MGSEILMLADAHYFLRMANNDFRNKELSNQLLLRNHGADLEDLKLFLEHCYYYGKSTRNLAIKIWWNIFRKRKVKPWLVNGKD